jgi:hypothetical protein
MESKRAEGTGRRVVLKGAALGALVFTIDGLPVALTPRQAHAAEVPIKILSGDERETIEALGEVLLPGAKDAGLAHYIDHQLAGPPEDCLLIARSMNVPAPYHEFYRVALGAIDGACQAAYQARFAALGPEQKTAFVHAMSQKNPDGWKGPPSPFVYFITRADAVDVVYGTVEGFEKLGVPYMPHILPKRKW